MIAAVRTVDGTWLVDLELDEVLGLADEPRPIRSRSRPACRSSARGTVGATVVAVVARARRS